MSRVDKTKKNLKFGYLGMLATLSLRFISRTVFIHTLGMTYLGVNGLYSNILSVLSFAELGIGTAMNYSLYKPVAHNETERIKSLMYLYRQAYRWIALIIASLGLSVLPFLNIVVKEPGIITSRELKIYYLIFLFNTVSSYLMSYKYSLVNAEQKNYVQTNIQTATTVIVIIAQLIVLFVFRNFLVYLLTASVIGLLQKIIVNNYLNRRYPYLLDPNITKLTDEDVRPIKKNIGGLVMHKVADISVHQTDNIIISAALNVTSVGLVGNYMMLIGSIQGILSVFFSSAVSSFGNLVATSNKDKQFTVYKVYNFIDFWAYGFTSIAFLCLLQPFITLWIGSDKLIDDLSLILICTNFYFMGQRISFLNFKTAHGIFYDDKYVVFGVAIINLAFSITLVRIMGLPGIYIGTVVSGLYQSIRRPMIAYHRITGDRTINYFIVFTKYFLSVLAPGFVLYWFRLHFLQDITLIKFMLMIPPVILIPNLWFLLLYYRTDEFKYIRNLLKRKTTKHAS